MARYKLQKQLFIINLLYALDKHRFTLIIIWEYSTNFGAGDQIHCNAQNVTAMWTNENGPSIGDNSVVLIHERICSSVSSTLFMTFNRNHINTFKAADYRQLLRKLTEIIKIMSTILAIFGSDRENTHILINTDMPGIVFCNVWRRKKRENVEKHVCKVWPCVF